MHCRKEVSMSRYSAQQSSISENNRSRILQYLYHNGICSRAQIAKAIKLTPAAITKITAKLLAQGIIEETGDMDGDKNRRSIGLNLNCAKYHIIGVKFARSLVQIAVFDLKCNRIFLSDLPTVSEEHIPETVERIRDTVRQLIKDDPSIVAVGMAVPGPYLRTKDAPLWSPPCRAGGKSTSSTNSATHSASPCSSNRTPAPARWRSSCSIRNCRKVPSPTICLAKASASESSTTAPSTTASTAPPRKSDTSPST